jgi:hypothetical protein
MSIVGPVCVWIERVPAPREPVPFAEELRRRVLSTFAQEPPGALRFAEGRLVGHDDISFSLARAWVAAEDAHAIVLGVSRGVEVSAAVAADATSAGDEAVRRLAGGGAVTMAWRPLPGACVAVAWRQRPALALAA